MNARTCPSCPGGSGNSNTATESHRFIWNNKENATGVNHNGAERRRRQDLEPEYSENGAVYVMRTPGFLQSRHRFFGKTVISEMPTCQHDKWRIGCCPAKAAREPSASSVI